MITTPCTHSWFRQPDGSFRCAHCRLPLTDTSTAAVLASNRRHARNIMIVLLISAAASLSSGIWLALDEGGAGFMELVASWFRH